MPVCPVSGKRKNGEIPRFFALDFLLVTAGARAAAAAVGHCRGREEIVHRELHRIEDLARVLAAAVAAGKRALVGRNAVVVHGDEKLRVAL